MTKILDFNNAPRAIPAPQRIDADEITRALKLRIKDYVSYLFPRIAIRRGEGRIGSLSGEPGESLSITLEGADAGLWIDHATGESGNLIQLYEQCEGVPFNEALDGLAAWLGWSDRPIERSQRAIKRASQPERKDEPLGAPAGAWNYLDADGKIIVSVYRYETPTGKTYRPYDAVAKRHAPPEIRPLYNIPALLKAEKIILCEGEKTADAINAAGYTATTMMSGAKAPTDKTDWSPIIGKQITLWRDNDQAGRQWQADLTAHLRGLGCVLSAVEPPLGRPEGWDAADTDEAEIRAILGAAKAPEARFKFRKAAALKNAPPPEFIVDGYIIENTFASLFGPSGSGKSFIAIDIALCVAHGKEWQEKPVKQATVAYIAGEGAGGFGARIAAWDQKHGLDTETAPFFFLGEAVNLLDAKQDISDLFDALDAINPGLVIIDTLARSFGGGDENTAKDMMAFVASCGAIQARYNATVAVVHHSGKDAEKGARGSSAFRAALDTEIQITKTEGMPNITLKTTKQKDAEEAPPISLRLQQIECQVGEAGEVKKSCVVMQDEGLFAGRRKKLSENQIKIIQLLEGGRELTIPEIVSETEVAYTTVETNLAKLLKWGFAEVIPHIRPSKYRRKQPIENECGEN